MYCRHLIWRQRKDIFVSFTSIDNFYMVIIHNSYPAITDFLNNGESCMFFFQLSSTCFTSLCMLGYSLLWQWKQLYQHEEKAYRDKREGAQNLVKGMKRIWSWMNMWRVCSIFRDQGRSQTLNCGCAGKEYFVNFSSPWFALIFFNFSLLSSSILSSGWEVYPHEKVLATPLSWMAIVKMSIFG